LTWVFRALTKLPYFCYYSWMMMGVWILYLLGIGTCKKLCHVEKSQGQSWQLLAFIYLKLWHPCRPPKPKDYCNCHVKEIKAGMCPSETWLFWIVKRVSTCLFSLRVEKNVCLNFVLILFSQFQSLKSLPLLFFFYLSVSQFFSYTLW
jgi:hypothetical protein